MVRLRAYRCHNCSLICEISAENYVGICVECGKLTCGPCRTLFGLEAEKVSKCTVTQKNCRYASLTTYSLDFLLKFAPEDELKLLNYGKWCPIWCCDERSSSFVTQRISFVGDDVHCASCRPAGSVTKNPPINTCMKIIDELRDCFSDQCYGIPHRRGVKLDSFQCETCRGMLPSPFHLSKTGSLLCGKCRDRVATSYTVRAGNLDFLDTFIRFIPDVDDLKLLTYSKWTPLRCELCSTLFSTNFIQLPMFHPGCSKLMCNKCAWKHTCSEANTTSILLKWVLDVDKQLRSFFKNRGDDPLATRFKNTEKQTSRLCLPSSYDLGPLSAVSGIPQKIRCVLCSQLNAPTNLRTCIDCNKSCLCLACLTKDHWGHHIEEIATSLQLASIHKESVKTLEKLSKLKESVTEGYIQIDAVNMKVVDNYKLLYTKAIRGNDLALLQAIKERGDIGPVQKSVDEFTVAQIKLRSNVEELEKSLSDIVKEHSDDTSTSSGDTC